MNRRAVAGALGRLLLLLAAVLAVPLAYALVAPGGRPGAERLAFAVPLAVALGLGALLRRLEPPEGDPDAEIGTRDGFAIVTLAWLLTATVGCLPFMIVGGCGFTNAWFETISGFTTTGASILPDPALLPWSLLLWRALTHWIGGLGIVVLSVAVLPAMGAHGLAIVRGESSTPSQRLRPRLAETARLLWGIYAALTGLQTLLLWFGGMGFLDALCHAMATLSTGGFSTKATSLQHYGSLYLEVVCTVFMAIGALNFILVYVALVRGRPRRAIQDPELRGFLGLLGLAIVAVALLLVTLGGKAPGTALREAAFNVTSVISTTGFANADWGAWPAAAQMVLLACVLIGGCVGSTSGGIKVSRFLIAVKVALREVRLIQSPRAVVPIRLGEHPIEREAVSAVLGYVLLFLGAVGIGTLILTICGLGPWAALSGAASCLGSVGPGFAEVGPMACYAGLTDAAKWTCAALMLLGRLEIYTLLVVLLPSTWRR